MKQFFSPILFVIVLTFTNSYAIAQYPNKELLVDVSELIKSNEKYHIVDARATLQKSSEGQIPNSFVIPLEICNKTFLEGKADAEFWKKTLAMINISEEKPVVVYGNSLPDVCRAWWFLKYAGVKDARVMNGNVAHFKNKGGMLSNQAIAPTAKPVDWTINKDRLANKDELMDEEKVLKLQIIDARTRAEYTGASGGAKRKGHMPTAKHLDWAQLADEKTGQFKSADELKKMLDELKIDPTKACATYCQSGGRSSVMAFTLELMGGKNVKNYYRSWSEWGNDESTKIEK